MWKQKIAVIIFGVLSVFGYRYAPEGLKYGSGVYTNVCGSGTTARLHSCSSFCDPIKGACVNDKGWVAKWVCDGKQTDCGDNESWGHKQSLENTECDRTVTLAVFDKNCRVGGWSCTEDNLKDYMVWYSGECRADVSVTVTVTGTPTIAPSPTMTPKPSVTPTPTGVVTVTGTPKPSFTTTPTPTAKPVAQKAPETGVDLIGMSLGLVGAIGVGWWVRRRAAWFWPD